MEVIHIIIESLKVIKKKCSPRILISNDRTPEIYMIAKDVQYKLSKATSSGVHRIVSHCYIYVQLCCFFKQATFIYLVSTLHAMSQTALK